MDPLNVANGTSTQQAGPTVVRSCLTCAKAKAKCIWTQDGNNKGACQRCARLGKECIRKEAVARRKMPEKPTRAARLQKLESKLDHLVNALSSSTSTAPVVTSTDAHVSSLATSVSLTSTVSPPTYQTITPARSDLSQPSPAFRHASHPGISSHKHDDVLGTMCASVNNHDFDETTKNPLYAQHISISPLEAEISLERYMRLMASYMPFVVLPADSTPLSLYREHPLLLRATVTVAMFNDLPRQRSLVKEIIRDIGERIMAKGERSIDLLQCIMVVVAWYHPHSFWQNQMTMLLHLAIALTVDTNIDRPAPKLDLSRKVTDQAQDLAKHRVLLGVFYYTSTMGTNFGNKMSALTFTPYMEQCLSVIESVREYESDLNLVQTVRTQQLIGTIVSTSSLYTPNKVYMTAIRADIDKIRQDEWCSQNHARIDDDIPLRFHRLTAELHAWEVALADLFEHRSDILTKHLEDVYGCLTTIQAIFDLFFAIPISNYFFFTFSVFDHFVYGLLTFTKLALVGGEPWIRNALNEKMRFAETYESFCGRFEIAGKTSPDGIPIDNDSFSAWGKKLRWGSKVWEAKMSHHTQAATFNGDKEGDDGHGDRLARTFDEMSQPNPVETSDNAGFFNYLDMNFWDSLGGDFDLGF